MKKTMRTAFGALIFSLILSSCAKEEPTDLTKSSIIPLPESIVASGQSFKLNKETVICYDSENKELKEAASFLSQQIQKFTGLELLTQASEAVPSKGIYLSAREQQAAKESYQLDISKKQIVISSSTSTGCFWGIQTLLQLLPTNSNSDEIKIATGKITDAPVYAHRGAMLDVARHFFEVNEVKRFINLLAFYKMNILHLHLTDDQGWRIEIKSWPKLTEIGGSTEVGGGKGGFYTQAQFSDIVKYAQERHITIIPEIDMPGHTFAALASYAELNSNNKTVPLYTGTKVGQSTLDANKKITYQFIDDVIRELAALTPGEYIHIGGDESLVTKHDDYVRFINQAQKIVQKYNKKVIGWDEIAHASLEPNTIVQYWAHAKNTLMGIEQGAKVIMSPAAKAYLDMKYDTLTTLGLHWAGYVPVDTAYNWDPATLDSNITKDNVWGIEAPLWTETVTNLKELEYMTFPRIPGYAEIGWTKTKLRNWNNYQQRLAHHGKWLDKMGVNFFRSTKIKWETNNSEK